MDIKIAFFDVDSTLTAGPNMPVVESAARAINAIQKKGVKIVIASGRIAKSIPSIEGLIQPDYYICPNGAAVVDKDYNILYQRTIDRETYDDINDYCEKNDLGFIWKYPDMILVTRNNEYVQEIVKQMSNVHYGKYPNPNVMPNAGGFLCTREQFLKARERYSDRFTVVDGGCIVYDLDLKGVNKQTGMEELLKILNLKREESIAFGDSDNDVDMVRFAGIGVAMGNGFDSVKKVADHITDDAANDGIEKALKKFSIL